MDASYDLFRGELDLARWRPSPTDEAIAGWVAERQPAGAIPVDTLLIFAKRRSVQALRESDVELASQALLCLTLLDPGRADPRDLMPVIGLAQHAVWRLGGDVDRVLAGAARLAPAGSRAAFEKFLGVDDAKRSLAAQGLEVVITRHGLGVVERWTQRYAPRTDLGGLAVEVADVVDTHDYQTTAITVAASLPSVWLKGGLSVPLRGCARVGARWRTDDQRDPVTHILTIFLAETGAEAQTERLVAAASPPADATRAAMALAYGPLFCLTVARPAVEGLPNRETGLSLRRMAQPLRHLLELSGTRMGLGDSDKDEDR